MPELALLAGIEAVLIVSLTMKLHAMRRLEREIQQTTLILAHACSLAAAARYEEAHAVAQRWYLRMRAHRRRQSPV
jgi:hypothetical protein